MKSFLKRTTALAFAGALLTGCAVSSLPDIKASTPSGSAFDVALHKEYVALAEMEAAEYDWADADTFTVRARSVLEGNSPLPEEISARDLPAQTVPVLTAARERLMNALNAGGRDASPEHAAGAQGAFDCWMQEQEEDLQPEDIAACKKDFIFHIEKLEEAMKPKEVAAAAPKPVAPPPPLPKAIVIYFGFDSAKLTDAEAAKIDQAIAAYDSGKATVLRLAGHADTRGDAEYNQKLSEARVDAVFAALAAKGFNLTKIRTTALGEDLPAVQTGDNVKEQNNRRVVISFGR
ncbi:OmpA family protein [Hwanghaeella sp.]|uniref:OmpA family protein n=1 Tax=Hwanghaeella sp. TaxID=2605943 RepID=UPI003CCBECDE